MGGGAGCSCCLPYWAGRGASEMVGRDSYSFRCSGAILVPLDDEPRLTSPDPPTTTTAADYIAAEDRRAESGGVGESGEGDQTSRPRVRRSCRPAGASARSIAPAAARAWRRARGEERGAARAARARRRAGACALAARSRARPARALIPLARSPGVRASRRPGARRGWSLRGRRGCPRAGRPHFPSTGETRTSWRVRSRRARLEVWRRGYFRVARMAMATTSMLARELAGN